MSIAQLETDPHRTLARLRAHEPVSWVRALDAWLVSSHRLAVEVMRSAKTYTVDDPRFTTARVIGPSMLSLDGDEHTRHRSPFVGHDRPTESEPDLGDWVDAEARRLVRAMVPLGRAELRDALAAPLATATIARSLGLDDGDVTGGRLLDWYRAIVSEVTALSQGQPPSTAARTAVHELDATVARTVATSPGGLLGGIARQHTLSPDELTSNVAVMLFGAIETVEGMIANAFHHLLSNPHALGSLRAEPALLATAIDESLRLEPAAGRVDRYATRRVRLGDATIAVDDPVVVSLTAANRDPQVFADPDRYDLTRPNAHLHLAFARGPHTCLGSHLARLETGAALRAVLDLLPDLTLDADASAAPEGLVFRKPPAVVAYWSPPQQ